MTHHISALCKVQLYGFVAATLYFGRSKQTAIKLEYLQVIDWLLKPHSKYDPANAACEHPSSA